MLYYDEIRQKEENVFEKIYKRYPFNIKHYQEMDASYYYKRKLTAMEQIMIECCMLSNGMISDKQEKEIIKYNKKIMISEKRIPWECKNQKRKMDGILV